MDAVTELQNGTSNLTSNVLFSDEDKLSSWIEAVRWMRYICIPLIAAVGITGNTLSLLVLCWQCLTKSSCSVFLAALAVVDTLFLLSLVVNWLDGVVKELITTDTTCQLLIFITNVTGFLSVAFIAGYTFERFVAIRFPLKRRIICSVFRQSLAVGIMTLCSCGLYNYSFWASGMQQWGSGMICSHKKTYFKVLQIFAWVDTILTTVIPFILISAMNGIVLRTVLKSFQGQKTVLELRSCSKIRQYTRVCKTPLCTGIPKSGSNVSASRRRNKSKVRATKTLILVSVTFLCLHLPSYVVRLYNMISSVVINDASISEESHFLQEVTLLIYYSSFSCNCLMYTLVGRNFKKSLLDILMCKFTTGARREREKIILQSSTKATKRATPVQKNQHSCDKSTFV